MNDGSQLDPNGGQQWWLSNQGAPAGPHSEAFLLVGLKTGAVSPETLACPVGGQEWKRLCEWPAFATTCAMVPPPVPPQMQPIPARAPWSPQVIAWLGLLFSPIWVGIMAAINAKRLRTRQPAWRPIVIAIGATLIDLFVVSDRFTYSILPDLCLYLGTLWLIWRLDLLPQYEAFASWRTVNSPKASWLWPSITGIPLALFVALAFIVSPFMPLEPRDVCERFVAATSLSEAKTYCDASFWPALTAIFSQKDDPNVQVQFDLLGETDAPANVGGYLVSHRMYAEQKGEAPAVIEGFFHLRQSNGKWKIQDWYFTSINNEPASEPISVAANYRGIFPEAPPEKPESGSSSQKTGPDTRKVARGGVWFLSRWLSGSSGEKVRRRRGEGVSSGRKCRRRTVAGKSLRRERLY